MSLEALLDHQCDIYHITSTSQSPGYGLPASSVFSYPDEPDLSSVPCHFGIHSRSVTLDQKEPMQIMDSRIKLTLPIGTDVRINDKIIDCDTGYEYTAEEPHNIRDHHIFVYIRKETAQQPL